MTFGFQSLAMLAALSAVLIPLLIHLLHRRRYQVVDWGAMQFLKMSQTTRRRVRLEELLLMLLRMGLIAVLVLALAAPYASGPLLAALGERPDRDIVLIIDRSYRMGYDDGSAASPHEAARRWIRDFGEHLAAGDRVAVLLAEDKVSALIGELTPDHALVRERVAALPPPRGGGDLPAAAEEAAAILAAQGRQATREIVILTDGRRWGWGDPDTTSRWERLAARLETAAAQPDAERPHLRVVNLRSGTSEEPRSDFALAPLRQVKARAWTGQSVQFSSALLLHNFASYEAPWKIHVEIDGRPAQELTVPAPQADNPRSPVRLAFEHRFDTAGLHVVSLIIEPDLPPEKRPAEYRLKDCLPGDNRQDLTIEVLDTLPVLLVDGAERLTAESSTFYLQKALAQSPDPGRPAVVRPHAVPLSEFTPDLLRGKVRPSVLVLADLPRLSEPHREALEAYLNQGGAVLMILGERTDAAYFNKDLYRDGEGILPAKLEALAGDPAKPEQAA